jgi:hypothetical protein
MKGETRDYAQVPIENGLFWPGTPSESRFARPVSLFVIMLTMALS